MKRLLPLSAAIVAAALTIAGTASAQVAPLPAPPTASNTASSAIFDALLAVERAAGTNAAAVGPAGQSYTTAISQYNAGNLEQARLSAVSAIIQTGAAPLPEPSLNPPVIPQQRYVPMPAVLTTDQADAEAWVALARKAVDVCGAPGAAASDQIRQQYVAAVHALLARDNLAARTASQSVVTQCAAAGVAYAASIQASAAPEPLGSYAPEPIATLGPDPALAATPVPAVLPSTTPVPSHHGFRL